MPSNVQKLVVAKEFSFQAERYRVGREVTSAELPPDIFEGHKAEGNLVAPRSEAAVVAKDTAAKIEGMFDDHSEPPRHTT